ncbi:MAG: NAD(P)H-dependent oxidoreductase [Rubrivivax sp.]
MTPHRTGQAAPPLGREAFGERFRQQFFDPAYAVEADALARIEQIAWEAYDEGRKAPLTKPAGRGFADPTYEISTEWLDTRRRLRAAQKRQEDRSAPSRVLVICGSPRNDGSCPGEVSKTWRLATSACHVLRALNVEADLLDLSELTSVYGRKIHPCKGCVSTAMPLCHWPCSCYPNHALGQAPDWMAEIYERWVSAHGVLIVTPTHWYQSPTALKLMIDRLVCADGGNPDPTTTHGKTVEEARRLEAKGWDYPKHVAGRVYGVIVHGDVAGVESHRRNLTDWLDWMGLIDAGGLARLDRYVGYFEPYFESHDALDKDPAVQEEARNVARAVAAAVAARRAGDLPSPDAKLKPPRPK